VRAPRWESAPLGDVWDTVDEPPGDETVIFGSGSPREVWYTLQEPPGDGGPAPELPPVSPPVRTTGAPDESTVQQALMYVRSRLEEFRDLGTRQLPAMREQVTTVWQAAGRAGDVELEGLARDQFDIVTQMGAQWEMQNDQLQVVLRGLRAVGITALGQLPVIPIAIALGLIALAGAIAALLASRDSVGRTIAELVHEAVRSGAMTASEGARVLGQVEATTHRSSEWPTALVMLGLLAAVVWFVPRRPTRA